LFFMMAKMFKTKIKNINAIARSAAALATVAAVLWTAGPAAARLDELIREDAPYFSPPAAAVAGPQSLYTVRPGDTLWEIARRNGITIELLAAANGLADRDNIRAGQVLTAPSDYVAHRVQPGETLWDIARMYQVDARVIAARNGLSDINKIIVDQSLYVPLGYPGAGLTARAAAVWPLNWPLVGAITSPFGLRDGRPHEGIDIAAEEGTPIRAAAPGVVVFAGPRGAYGLAVIVDHGGGVRTLYAHCSRLLVAEGASVGPENIIALAGSTGRSTGPHLHMEVLKNGIPLDPVTCLGSYYG